PAVAHTARADAADDHRVPASRHRGARLAASAVREGVRGTAAAGTGEASSGGAAAPARERALRVRRAAGRYRNEDAEDTGRLVGQEPPRADARACAESDEPDAVRSRQLAGTHRGECLAHAHAAAGTARVAAFATGGSGPAGERQSERADASRRADGACDET